MRLVAMLLLVGCSTTPSSPDAGGDASVLDTGADGHFMDVVEDAADAGDADAAPSLVMLAAVSGPMAITVDTNNVYFTAFENGQGTILACAVGGCGLNPTTLATSQTYPVGIAVDGTNVYWSNIGGFNADGGSVGGAVMKCALGGCGGNPTYLYAGPRPSAVAVDSTNVYWTNAWDANSSVMECAIGGCGLNPTTIATGQNGASELAVDSTSIYWTNEAGGDVMKCAIGGCTTPTSLASTQGSPGRIAVDGTSVYWANYSAGTIMKCAIGGCGGNPTVLASGQPSPWGVAVDATNVYWTTSTSVMKCATGGCGGNPTTIVAGQSPWGAIAIDAISVYWTNWGNNTVMKFTPK